MKDIMLDKRTMRIAVSCLFLSAIMWTSYGTKAHSATLKDLFRENHNQILDFAIGSSAQVSYYYDMVNGVSAIGGSTPIIYFDREKIISGDIGFVSPYEAPARGTLAPGITIRVNRILDLYFPEATKVAKNFNETTNEIWSSLWFGPAYSYLVTNDSNKKSHIAWIKFGTKLW